MLVLLAKDPSVYLGVRSIINKGLTTAVYWRIKGNSDLGNDLNIQWNFITLAKECLHVYDRGHKELSNLLSGASMIYSVYLKSCDITG